MIQSNFMEKLLDGVQVEWKVLGDVINSLKTGLNPRKNFQLNTPNAEGFYVTVREIQNGKIIFLDKTDRVNDLALELINNRSNLEIGDILFSGTGTVGKTAVIEKQPTNWNIKEGVYVIKPKKEIINSRYLSHLLNSQDIVREYSKKIVGSPVVSLPMGDLKKLLIPIPPLKVQEEIVRILDTFTELSAELSAELTAELTARKKQYAYYRDKLLSFEEGEVEWKPLGEISDVTKLAGYEFTEHVKYSDSGSIIALRGLNIKKGFLDLSSVKYIDDSNFQKLTRSKLFIDDILFTYVGTIGEVALVDVNDKYYLAPNVARIRINNSSILPKFMKFYFQSHYFIEKQINRYLSSSSMKNLTMENIRKFLVPIPPLEEQERIVSILDKFDALTSSITEGLPREIELRQKQYEYYRNMLLSFPKQEV